MYLTHLGELIWLMLPAYIANMAPPFVKYWKGWNHPLHERYLGTHKTVVGFSFGVIAGLATAWAQHSIGGLTFVEWTWWQVGFMQGVGAMAGDSIKSFFKRRRGIPPGARWLPMDQLDFVIGALILSEPTLKLGLSDIVILLVLTFVGHILVNHIAYALHIRDSAW